MSPSQTTHCARAVLLTALLWSCGGRADPLAIPDLPLFLNAAGVPPNMIFTLDDSGSMSRAFTPDLCGNPNGICDNPYDSRLDGRFVKSAAYNPIYYNPTTTYTPPVGANGASLITSFSDAFVNGYTQPAGTKANLGTGYQPSAGLFLNSSTPTHQFMQHYSADVRCNSSSRCQYNSNVGVGLPNWVNMTSSASCSASSDCQRRTMPAYYYVYDATNSGCTGATLNAKLVNNSCYDIKLVSNSSGADRDGDGTISGAEADERQNFANWYSFYRTRNLMTASAASLAMATLPTTIRVAWQALNSCRGSTTSLVTSDCEGWETTTTNFSNAIKEFTGAQKTNFYSWIGRLKTNTGTPLREALVRAGQYYRLTGANSPYDDNLSSSVNTQAVCRKNYHVLMTDGIWNDSAPSSPSVGNFDNTTQSLPDGTSYPRLRPFLDNNTSSLADYAFYYWATDLAGLTDNVAPSFVDFTGTAPQRYFNPKNDPATWQHMVNFTVGLGLTPFLANTGLTWGTNTYDGSYPDLVSGAKSWPAVSGNADGNAADLWHAAINSRGRFYNVKGPAELNSAFQDIINTISSQAASGGGARVSSNIARLTDVNPTGFIARFNDDWSGSLEAVPINIDGTLGTIPYWEAGLLIPPGNGNQQSTARKIFTFNGGYAQEFLASICNGSSPLAVALSKDRLGVPDDLCSQRMSWLRGYTAITGASAWNSASQTITFTAPNHGLKAGNSVVVTGVMVTGTTPLALNKTYTITSVSDANHFTVSEATDPGGGYVMDENDADRTNDDKVRFANFRDRSSALGDIVNSGTVYAHKENFGYVNAGGVTPPPLTGAGDPYKTYVASKASRIPVVYVGANDGMLHAFNAEVCSPPQTCPNAGKELFAYVPAGVYGKLSTLTDLNYGQLHTFFVDGTPTLGDAYISGDWRTYLVGGLRSGGKNIYALDVSDPTNFDVADVKWDFTDSDMGLTFGQPQIAAVGDNQWAVIVGNGYNSAAEKAYLYLIDLADGTVIAKIATNNDTSNGLSTPYAFDADGDGIVDAIYAGDLQGHLWKFVKDATGGDWILANNGDPLFISRNTGNDVQSITGQPKAASVNGKIMVYFGTGRYLTGSDLTNDDMQTFYAIEDDSQANPGTVARSSLVQQTILDSNVPTPLFTARIVSQNPATPNSKGCYLDLPATLGQPSERITSTPLIKSFTTAGLNTRVIFLTSTPTSDPCEKSGTSWLMELSTNCGRLEGTSPFDINKDQKFDTSDLVSIPGSPSPGSVSGGKLKTETGIVSEITWVEGDITKGIAYKILPGSSGKVESIANSSDSASVTLPKRISWEQIQ